MLQRVLAVFREAKDAPRIEDAALVETLYRRKRNQVLLASMVAYGLFYFCRGNLSSALPLLKTDLHIEEGDIGKIGSWLFATYGVCKFLTGLVADRANPKTLMVVGLVLSAILNIAFGLSSDLLFLCFLWGMNGVVQSFGAPASAKVIAVWFSATERGAKTGIWNISHQAGGGIVLIFAGLSAQLLGWRGAMIVPALFSLVAVLFVVPFLHDRPESHGLPPVEEWSATKTDDEDAGESFLRMFLRRVLLNPRVWLIALASLCTYFVRYGALYYAPKYLKEVRGMPIWLAGSSSSLLEFLGIPGAFLCGWLSDKLGARRAPVVFGSLILLAVSTWALVRIPPGMFALDLLLLAAIGFFTYGPQMLLAGVAPVDMSSKRVAAA
ncbi:MAG: MFS transporter, partial [Planctomycetota bacterium]